MHTSVSAPQPVPNSHLAGHNPWNMFVSSKRSNQACFLQFWIVLALRSTCHSDSSSADNKQEEIYYLSNVNSTLNSTTNRETYTIKNRALEAISAVFKYDTIADVKEFLSKKTPLPVSKLQKDIPTVEEDTHLHVQKLRENSSGTSDYRTVIPNNWPKYNSDSSIIHRNQNLAGRCLSNPENGQAIWIGSKIAILHWRILCPANRCNVQCTSTTVQCPNGETKACKIEEWSCDVLRNGTLEARGEKLTRYTSYTCRIFAYIGLEELPGDREVKFRTRDGRPFTPGVLWISNLTSTSFVASWERSPFTDREPVSLYVLNVYSEMPNYYVNPACDVPRGTMISFNTTRLETFVPNLLPYYQHRVYVSAHNEYGSTNGLINDVITKPSAPGPCQNVSFERPKVLPDALPTFTVSWTEPCFWNGHPRDTVLTIKGRRPNVPYQYFYHEHFFVKTTNKFTFNASMDFNYTVVLSARIEMNPIPKTTTSWAFYIPPGLASVSKEWLNIRPEVRVSTEDESAQATIPISNSLLNETNGTVKYAALMVAEKGYEDPRRRKWLNVLDWPSVRSWYTAMHGDHVLLYQATPKFWKFSSYPDNLTHQYTLGADTCVVAQSTENAKTDNVTESSLIDEKIFPRDPKIVTSNLTDESTTILPTSEADSLAYCNGPLKKNVEYIVRLRVFTVSGYTDSEDVSFTTGPLSDNSQPFYKQVCFYAAFPMFFGIAVLILFWVRKRRRSANLVASNPLSDPIKSVCSNRKCRKNNRRRSISPGKLPKVVARFLSQKTDLEEEFEELNRISAAWAAKVPCTVGRLQENRLKNRYADVVPYDYNRVKLSAESTSHTDYINASFIQGFSLNVEYIACQGPTMETSNDFWQMIFDQNISLIVMLTSLVENGTAKCVQYFSELSENKEWMDFNVKCTSRLDLSNYTVRELELYKKTTQEKRSIKHLQFRDWPDFGCPRDLDGILEFCHVLRSNLCLRSYSTTVIHCSAGIGRTGTLIALDILLQYVHYNRKVDVMRTVHRLREQRQWMVRTVEQYAFLYRCLKTAAEHHSSSGL